MASRSRGSVVHRHGSDTLHEGINIVTHVEALIQVWWCIFNGSCVRDRADTGSVWAKEVVVGGRRVDFWWN